MLMLQSDLARMQELIGFRINVCASVAITIASCIPRVSLKWMRIYTQIMSFIRRYELYSWESQAKLQSIH
jgi:hypothetical protein